MPPRHPAPTIRQQSTWLVAEWVSSPSESGIIFGMTVDNTILLKALKKEKEPGDIPDALKREIAEDVHDYVTRRMGEEDSGK